MESTNHPITLKVMRVSRPCLTDSWQPFFTTSAAFSAHATESLMSLQGVAPLSGHPKTLRDLSYGLELLSLPATFGAIQLGETLASCLCVNNEAKTNVQFLSLQIEIQTATNKVVLKDVDTSRTLRPGELLETIVTHEMKELGQHVLGCSVSYQLTPTSDVQTLRKYYKFSVTNPIAVRSKVHIPRSSSAVSSRSEREKFFLEVHIQNLTQEPMWFEQLRLLPKSGWKVLDDGALNTKDSAISRSVAILQPQDIHQFVFTLIPEVIPSLPLVYAPGSAIELGRLDVSWRSLMGEPGRLLTSTLSRRVPPLVNPAPTAIPPHLQHRPHSPLSRSSTPPLPLTSPPLPGKSRPLSQQGSVRSQSPNPTLTVASASAIDLDVDLVVHSFSHSQIKVSQPFEIEFQLTLSGLLPAPGMKRLIQVAVQHVTPTAASKQQVAEPSINTPSSSPRVSIDSQTKPFVTRLQEVDSQSSPIRKSLHPVFIESPDSVSPMFKEENKHTCFPSPLSSTSKSSGLIPLGSSVIWLPQYQLSHKKDNSEATEIKSNAKGIVGTQFRCQFVAAEKGFGTIGSLRLLLVEDRIVQDDGTDETPPFPSHESNIAKPLKEWDAISDIWVTG